MHLHITFTSLKPGTQSSLTWLETVLHSSALPGGPDTPAHPPKPKAPRSREEGGPRAAAAGTLPANPPLGKRTSAEPSWTPWAAVAPPLAPPGSAASEHSPTVPECATWTGRQRRRLPARRPKATRGTAEPPEEKGQAAPEATQPPPSSQPGSAGRQHFTFFRLVPPSSGSAGRGGAGGVGAGVGSSGSSHPRVVRLFGDSEAPPSWCRHARREAWGGNCAGADLSEPGHLGE